MDWFEHFLMTLLLRLGLKTLHLNRNMPEIFQQYSELRMAKYEFFEISEASKS